MSGLPFTPEAYGALLDRLRDAGVTVVGFDDPPGDGELALRHDVDLSVERALAMAEQEADRGVATTYLLLVAAPAYDLLDPTTRSAVERIDALGHDVGLHFDPHRHWPDGAPPPAAWNDRVRAEHRSLAGVVDAAPVVSTHVPPAWALGRTVEGLQHTYAPAYFEDATYVSDSNQKWRAARPFPDGPPAGGVQMLVHPGLWTPDDRALDALIDEVAARGHGAVDAYTGRLG